MSDLAAACNIGLWREQEGLTLGFKALHIG